MVDWRSNFLRDVKGRVLEVGAGDGPNLDRYTGGIDLVATEFDEATLSEARAKANAHIRLACADIEHLGFASESFDCVTATLVFCSVERPVIGLQEVKRVLKPGGKLYMIEHVRSDRPWLGRFQDRLARRWYKWTEGCNLNRDTEANIRAAGFQIENLRVRWLGLVKTIVASKAI